jgi:hypothetical protein
VVTELLHIIQDVQIGHNKQTVRSGVDNTRGQVIEFFPIHD